MQDLNNRERLILIEGARNDLVELILKETGVMVHVYVHIHDTDQDTLALNQAAVDLDWDHDIIPSEGPDDYVLWLAQTSKQGGTKIYYQPDRER